MTISIEAVTDITRAGEGTYTATLDAGTDPKGVLVLSSGGQDNGRPTGPASWDGTNLASIPEGFIGSLEVGSVYGWFLGSGLTSGSATFTFTSSPWTGVFSVIFLNGAGDLEINDVVTVDNTTGTNHTTTLALSSIESFIAQACFYGNNLTTNATSTGFTRRAAQNNGANASFIDTYNTIGTSDATVGFTGTNSDDGYVLAVAINEVGGGGSSIPVILNSYRNRTCF